MSLGYDVNKGTLDMKAAQTVLQLRQAFDGVEAISAWLSNHPSDGTNDPLVADFGYSADEAYVLRNYFETFNGVRIANANTFDVGRKMTGLE
jgi:hypothetical protein